MITVKERVKSKKSKLGKEAWGTITFRQAEKEP